MKLLQCIGKKVVLAGVLIGIGAAWETVPALAAEAPIKLASESSVSENSISENSVSENSLPGNSVTIENDTSKQNEGTKTDTPNETAQPEKPPVEEGGQEVQLEEAVEIAQEEQPVAVSPDQFQTVNYKEQILTDWQQILDALASLTPQALTGYGEGDKTLVLQLQNVENIPAAAKDSIGAGGTEYTKILQCSLGSGVSIVLNGSGDNGGFHGISNTNVSVASEKRGKKSVATTVRFASHEDIGAVVSLQVNLPQCSKGTKVSVYAETVAIDDEGNVTVGENACIGTTKAGENGNVEIPIQSTANYMFVYKGAKE
ncbi:hypothetical protein D3Z45_09445 [Lachnospiraceae bacterium]|nr:hypothetical protein [Lachnospiraceae bacterium]